MPHFRHCSCLRCRMHISDSVDHACRIHAYFFSRFLLEFLSYSVCSNSYHSSSVATALHAPSDAVVHCSKLVFYRNNAGRFCIPTFGLFEFRLVCQSAHNVVVMRTAYSKDYDGKLLRFYKDRQSDLAIGILFECTYLCTSGKHVKLSQGR